MFRHHVADRAPKTIAFIGTTGSFAASTSNAGRCSLWVISGASTMSAQCPHYPLEADLHRPPRQVAVGPAPDSCTAANDVCGCNVYSITSSARPSTVSGMMRPSAFAVLRLLFVPEHRAEKCQRRHTGGD